MSNTTKRIGIALGGLVTLVLVAGVGLYVVGSGKIAAAHSVAVSPLAVPADSASIARGAHLAQIYGCTDCHGSDLSGLEMENAPPFRLVASNLTPAGRGAEYTTAADWDRAIRHGVRPDGTALFAMPSGAYNKVADTEAVALIAYLQTLPPVENDLRGVEWKPMGRLLAAGPIDLASMVYTSAPPKQAPAPDSTVAYGEYVAKGMCAYCHGENLEGQIIEGPEEVLAPDLRASGAWTADQFHRTLTTGVKPDGTEMDPLVMPWTTTAAMTLAEREGVRRYLAQLGLPPEATTDT
ncbi:MAG: c-type cytochrome [Bacteroidota bacterium]